MRHDPRYLFWIVRSPSAEEAHQLQELLAHELSAETTFVDELRAFPDGVETVSRQPHRLGDYFERVRVVPEVGQRGSFGILFHRRPNPGRFWKDLMALVLQKIRREAPSVTTALEYQGDEEPDAAHSDRE